MNLRLCRDSCSRQTLLDNVESVRHEPGAKHRNRLGILLGNKETPETKTLTHVLWSLLNVLPAGLSLSAHPCICAMTQPAVLPL